MAAVDGTVYNTNSAFTSGPDTSDLHKRLNDLTKRVEGLLGGYKDGRNGLWLGPGQGNWKEGGDPALAGRVLLRGASVIIGSGQKYVDQYGHVVHASGWNVIIGSEAARDITTGLGYVNIGWKAGQTNSNGIHPVCIGSEAGATWLDGSSMDTRDGGTSATNITCLGQQAKPSGNNQVQLGNSASTTYAYGSVQDRSDRRDKLDIKALDDTSNLDKFFMSLKPKSYRMNYRDNYFQRDEDGNFAAGKDGLPVAIKNDGSLAGKRHHWGMIAQEVKESMDECGIDFAGFQDHSIGGGKDVLSLGYQEFIPLIIHVVQKVVGRLGDIEKKLK